MVRGGLAAGAAGLLPSWARSATQGNVGLVPLQGARFDLSVDRFAATINGKQGNALGINGTIPAPLIRFREGDDITIHVTNHLDEGTSIHWHGLLVPFHMDGIPGISFPGIRPGETFTYRFSVPQNGTYWYHSHSGLQEQLGMYGPLIIDPRDADPVAYDREYVLVLSDWTFRNPHSVYRKLKAMSETFNYSKRTFGDFLARARRQDTGTAVSDFAMWARMRMSPRDIADVTGATYHFLVNGHTTADNWNGVVRPGERVRLRIINGSAMTIFNVRIPGLPMTIVQSDGLNVQPVEVDEFQIGVAETYDAIIEPDGEAAYAFVAESIDRSGQVVATLGTQPGMRADPPALRSVPTLTMRDMGMDHGAHGDMAAMDQGSHSDMPVMDHGTHGEVATMDHGSDGGMPAMDHSSHGDMPAMDHSSHDNGAAMDQGSHGEMATMDHGTHGDATTMDHGSHNDGAAMDHGAHDAMAGDAPTGASTGQMDHGQMDHGQMDHGQHAAMPAMPVDPTVPPSAGPPGAGQSAGPAMKRGPGVMNIAEMPANRLDEPGTGLEDVPHRALRYSQLRSLDPNPDTRAPERELDIHLTGNMERYMWSFNGDKLSEVTEPFVLYAGERARLTMTNHTMMNHPIHLHGMFFDVVNGGGDHCPRKHTIIVKPGERLSVDVSPDRSHLGDWAFHCHLLFHMHAGMMQVVSVLPRGDA